MSYVTPWICYGQTAINSMSDVQNPQPNCNGLIGECVSLPYTVPAGKILRVTTFQIEQLWGAAIIPWIGNSIDDFVIANCLSTMCWGSSLSGHNATDTLRIQPTIPFTGFDYQIPAGKKFNIRINTSYSPSDGWIYGWYVGGELLDS